MANFYKCANCGHGSGIKSNFKGTSEGKFYCNSSLREQCEGVRQYEIKRLEPKQLNHNFNPINWR